MNRTIVITGANNGIGLALTRSLLEMGDCVAALDLSLENLDQTHPMAKMTERAHRKNSIEDAKKDSLSDFNRRSSP